jgi:IS30 family transposase
MTAGGSRRFGKLGQFLAQFNSSAIGTDVERKTRLVILSKMPGCTANAALEGFTRQIKRLPVALRQSMTYDRGSEMACHPELSRRLKIDIWFCNPHAPWQRGSNENTNGLLRQFFPKGTYLSCLSQTALNDVARMMNHRPRKTLGWRTPAEAMAKELAVIKSNVAPQALIKGAHAGGVALAWACIISTTEGTILCYERNEHT